MYLERTVIQKMSQRKNCDCVKRDFFLRIVSETVRDDGFVDCVWEMPAWAIDRLEADARSRGITVSELVSGIFKAYLEGESVSGASL